MALCAAVVVLFPEVSPSNHRSCSSANGKPSSAEEPELSIPACLKLAIVTVVTHPTSGSVYEGTTNLTRCYWFAGFGISCVLPVYTFSLVRGFCLSLFCLFSFISIPVAESTAFSDSRPLSRGPLTRSVRTDSPKSVREQSGYNSDTEVPKTRWVKDARKDVGVPMFRHVTQLSGGTRWRVKSSNSQLTDDFADRPRDSTSFPRVDSV